MNRARIVTIAFISIYLTSIAPGITQVSADSTLSFSSHTDTLITHSYPEIPEFPLGDISFADSVVLYDPGAMGPGTGDEPDLEFQNARFALGTPDSNPHPDSGSVSLGIGGTLIMKFTDNVLIDGPGPDLFVFHASTNYEETFLWISQDGITFIPVGKTSFYSPLLDIQNASRPGAIYPYIKLRDDQSQERPDHPALGADIDAVGAINTAIHQVIYSDNLFREKTWEFQTDPSIQLKSVADKIDQISNVRVRIEGHTDSPGTLDYTRMISQLQADAIKNFLIDEMELTHPNYTVIGWGKSKPAASNDTDEGRQKNRRIEILIQSGN